MGNCIYMLGGSVFALLFAIPFAAVAARRERLCATYQMHRDETSRLSSDGSTLDEYKKEQNRPVWRTQRSWREEEMRSSSSM